MGIDLTKVRQEIKLWNRCRNDKNKFHDLKNLRAFGFEMEGKIPLGHDVHVYPGLKEDETVSFYLISTFYDTKANERDLEKYIIQATTISNVNPAEDPLPGSDAHDRILCWEEYFDLWIETAVSHDNVFESFIIPNEDLPALQPKIIAYFGLLPNIDENGTSYNTDVILTAGPEVVFEDTVMPVPPFGSRGKTERSNFFLLELSLR